MRRWLPSCQRRCRYSLLVFAPSAAGVLLASGWLAQSARQNALEALELNQRHGIDLADQAFTNTLSFGLRGLEVAQELPELQQVLRNPTPANRQALGAVAATMAKSLGLYDQIRLLDPAGREQVRVNWDGRRARVIPDGDLQDKSDRYYFTDAKRLPAGGTYLSPLDLNIENGRIEAPKKPMLRVARPLTTTTGKDPSFLVLNLLAEPMLQAFADMGRNHRVNLLLVNGDGYGLRTAEPANDWGFMSGKPAVLPNRYPQAWRLIQSQRSGQQRLASGLWTWRTIQPFTTPIYTSDGKGGALRPFSAQPHWIAISQVAPQALRQLEWQVTAPIAGVSALLIAGVAGLSRWIGRRLEQGRQDGERLALVAQNAADVVFAADSAGVLTWVSDSALTLLGLERQALLGRSIAALLMDEDRPLAEQALSQAAQGQSAQFEARLGDAAGREHWLDISIRPVPAARGQAFSLAGSWRTIDAERQAERDRRQADRQMAAVMASSPVGLVLATPQGRFVEVNPAFCAMLDRSRDELLAATWQEITHPADLETDLDLVQQVINGQINTYRRRKRHLKPDGSVIWSDLSVAALRAEDGSIERLIGQVIDITASVENEQQLTKARNRYRLLAENASDVVLQADHKHQLQWVSPSAPALFSAGSDALIDSFFPDWLHPEDRQAFEQLCRRLEFEVRATHSEQSQLLRLRRWDNSDRWVALRMTLLRDRGQAIYGEVLALRDVHEETIARQQLDQQQTFLKATLNSLLDPHLTLDPLRDENGRILDFLLASGNKASFTFLGVEPSRLVGRRLTSIFPGVAEQGLLDRYRHVMATGEPLVLTDFTYTDQEVLGHDITVDISAVRAAGSLSLTWRDVGERYSRAQALAASEERYRLLAENATDLILHIKDHKLVWISTNAETILGAPPPYWIGKGIQELLHPEEHSDYLEAQAVLERNPVMNRPCRLRNAAGEYHWFSVSARTFRDATGRPDGSSAALRNIDAEVAAATELDYRARHDLLTGLINRTEAISRLEALLAHTDPRAGQSAVLFIDIDKFKQVNDTYGHAAGDAVLITLAQRITGCLRQGDLAARMGGDELLIVLSGLHDPQQATAIAEKLRRAAEQPITSDGTTMQVSFSIGVAIANAGDSVDALIARADAAMYAAKQAGRNQVISIDSRNQQQPQRQQG